MFYNKFDEHFGFSSLLAVGRYLRSKGTQKTQHQQQRATDSTLHTPLFYNPPLIHSSSLSKPRQISVRFFEFQSDAVPQHCQLLIFNSYLPNAHALALFSFRLALSRTLSAAVVRSRTL